METNLISEAAGLGTWFQEKLTPKAWVRMFAEGLIPDYGSKMEALRMIDDQIFSDLDDSKKLIDDMITSLKAARYVDVALSLEEFHKVLQKVFLSGTRIKEVQEKAVKEFDLRRASYNNNQIVVVAGWWSDLVRSWVANKFEDSFRRERRVALEGLVSTAIRFQNRLNAYQTQLGKFRAQGEIAQYVDALNRLDEEYRAFKSESEPIFNQYLKPILSEVRIEADKKQEEENKRLLEEKTREEGGKLFDKARESLEQAEEQHKIERKDNIKKIVDDVLSNKPEPSTPLSFTAPPFSSDTSWSDQFTGEKSDHVINIKNEPIDEIKNPEPSVSEQLITEHPLDKVTIEKAPKLKSEKTKSPRKPREKKNKKEESVELETPANDPAKEPVVAHELFISQLKKIAATQDPYILANMILEYSEMIEDRDLNKSLELLAVAEGILDQE